MKVRGDILKLSLASYLCQLTGEVAPREENAQEYLRLLLNSLYFLDSDKRTCEFIKPLYELRIMTMAGYMPNLVACCECASFEKAEMYFLPLTSQLICGDCVKNLPENQIKYLLNPGVLAAMRHIIYAGDEKLFNFTLSSPLLKQLNQISQEYIKCHLEKKFDTLDFYLTMSD